MKIYQMVRGERESKREMDPNTAIMKKGDHGKMRIHDNEGIVVSKQRGMISL